MRRFAVRILLSTLLLLGCAGAQPAPQPRTQGIADILHYIDGAWQTLTRSMQDCQTVVDKKFPRESTLYVPADGQRPQSARDIGQRCNVRVQPLPQAIERVGQLNPKAIARPGLLYLPNPYVVPGGLFNEMYGWDSYFIIRGLLQAGKLELARGMVENFFYEIDHYGAILNANRTYFLSRSQPPFLSSMVMSVYSAQSDAGQQDKTWLARAYNYIIRDHALWTTGEHLAGNTGLSRYYDFGEGPAPELYGHDDRYYDSVARWFIANPTHSDGYLVSDKAAGDLPAEWPRYSVQVCGGMRSTPSGRASAETAASSAPACEPATTFSFTPGYYKGDRSMRESGYDISFRFGPFGASTQDYAAVDLNSLLYKEEDDLQQIAGMLGRTQEARQWAERAATRKQAMNRLMWDQEKGMFFDYDFTRARRSDYAYITAFFPLWAGLATPAQAKRMQQNLGLFEQPGGLVTSRRETGVQWDYPWGWAPNQLIAVEGLRRYKFDEDANRVSLKFLSDVLENFRREGTIREKYNVVSRSTEAAIQAGYRQNMVGFGWTNGVFLTLLRQLPAEWVSRLETPKSN